MTDTTPNPSTSTNGTGLIPSQQRQSALVAMANRFDMDPATLLHTLKQTVFKGATNEQLAALVVVANEHGLNPFTREIYAFPDRSGGIQAVIGVDGWLRIINSHPSFDGVEFAFGDDSCTCTMHVKGRSHPVRVTEFLSECRRPTPAWESHPRRMLRHRALIQAARIAFGLASLKDEEDVVMHPASATVRAWPVERPVFLPSHDQGASTTAAQAESDAPKPVAESQPKEETPAPKPQGRRHARKSDAATSSETKSAPSPQDRLADAVVGAGYNYDQWIGWAVEAGQVDPTAASSWTGFCDVPANICERLLNAKSGMVSSMAEWSQSTIG